MLSNYFLRVQSINDSVNLKKGELKIAVAQIKAVRGDISSNILTHKKLIQIAISNNADSIFFPELSITGYEPELAKELAINEADEPFNEFQDISDRKKITIGLGMPTKTNSGVRISMLIYQPNKPRQIYSKQLLHADELPYFIRGDKQLILTVNGKKVAPAICYESLQNEHSEKVNNCGAEIYLASVAKSQNGIDKAMQHYPAIALRSAMPVLMSNCVGYCDNFESVGKSSAWTKEGKLVGQLDNKLEGILIFDTETEEVVKRTL
jgi:predicted amidohydrolase